ncbi:MAG: phage tail protein [Angelakisella sp.]|jgi:hypothetical protein|nr:phage tail protein [Angelakisella sp.]
MAIVGCLGDVVFAVSDATVRTLDNMSWSGSVRYAAHERHLGDTITEFTGVDPDKITFDITLLADLGVSPMAEADKIGRIMRSGRAVPLTIGTARYGRYRWNITKYMLKSKAFDRSGNLQMAVLSVSLQEYLRG